MVCGCQVILLNEDEMMMMTFNRLRASEILIGNFNVSYSLHLMPSLGVFPLEFREKV